jgi:hypothetical protein
VTCAPASPSLDICPTQEEIIPQLLALLPRGRAWSTHDGLPQPETTIWKYWNVLAAVWAVVNKRICDIRKEFFCITADETLDLWDQEYGLPDGCDPFPNLCVKVAALGGATCAFYAGIAASLGWSILCPPSTPCSPPAGCIEAGMVPGGTYVPASLQVFVDLAASPAYDSSVQTVGPVAGFLEAGMPVYCGPDLTALDCLMQRIVHAEVDILYITF